MLLRGWLSLYKTLAKLVYGNLCFPLLLGIFLLICDAEKNFRGCSLYVFCSKKLERFGRTGSIQYGSLFQQIIYSHAIDFAWVRIESAILVSSKYRKLVLFKFPKNNSTWSFNLLKLWHGAVCSWPHCRGKYHADLKLQRCNWGEVWVRIHDDVIKWKHFPRNWPFVRGIHRSQVISPHKGQ